MKTLRQIKRGYLIVGGINLILSIFVFISNKDFAEFILINVGYLFTFWFIIGVLIFQLNNIKTPNPLYNLYLNFIRLFSIFICVGALFFFVMLINQWFLLQDKSDFIPVLIPISVFLAGLYVFYYQKHKILKKTK